MKLFRFRYSPYARKVQMVLDLLGARYEDVLFRVASPAVRDAWPSPGDRALYVLVKERKFGAGCVDAWESNQAALVERARHLLAPSLKTIAARRFLFGDAPTLADAALYGLCKMLEEADPVLLPRVAEALVPFVRRLEEWAAKAGLST